MPELSVIVPVYNVEEYLRECVDSILAQTFTDFELLLIDDGSTDLSGAICDGYAGSDPRVRVFHRENAGQSAARNRGVAEAAAELICFIDADDAVNPVLLQELYRAMRENGAGAAVSARVCGAAPPDGFYIPIETQAELFTADEQSLLHLFQNNDTLYWTMFPCLIKKRILTDNPLPEGRVMEDNAITCRWLVSAGSVARIAAPLYFYRENPSGTMRSKFSEKNLDYLWALKEQLAFFEALGYSELPQAVANHYVENAVWLASRVRRELNDPALARGVIADARAVYRQYAPTGCFSAENERKLFKAAHPFLHRIRKKLRLR